MSDQLINRFEYLIEKASFLLLEDTPSLRTELIFDMRSFGFKGTIHEANCVVAAKKILNAEKIDFIISDWNLPDGTGYHFLLSIRDDERFRTTPFLMWTTVNEAPKIVDAIVAGAHEYLLKPWKKDDVYQKILSVWKKVHGTSKA